MLKYKISLAGILLFAFVIGFIAAGKKDNQDFVKGELEEFSHLHFSCPEKHQKYFKVRCDLEIKGQNNSALYRDVLIKIKNRNGKWRDTYSLYFEKKDPFFPRPKSRVWRLKPLDRDPSRIREKLSWDFYSYLNPSFKLPKATWVMLSFNNQKARPYLLVQKLGRKMLGIKGKKKKEGMIFEAKSGSRDQQFNIQYTDEVNEFFKQRYPDLYRYNYDKISHLKDLTKNVINAESLNELWAFFDKKSFINYVLFSILSGNRFQASYYLGYLPANQKFSIIQHNDYRSWGISFNHEVLDPTKDHEHSLFSQIYKKEKEYFIKLIQGEKFSNDLMWITDKINSYKGILKKAPYHEFSLDNNEINYIEKWIERRSDYMKGKFKN